MMANKLISQPRQPDFINQLTSLADLLRWMTTNFQLAELYFGHGYDNAWDEAVALLTYCFKLTEPELSKLLAADTTQFEREQLWQLVDKRINLRWPLPYITNQVNFAGLEFYVDQRVIIPRSPIAELIENQFSPWLGDHQPQKVLDMCTGSGCIAAACAVYYPEANVWAVDKDDNALAVAKINIDGLGLAKQVKLIKSDLFNNLPTNLFNQFDIIIANPPYVSQDIMQDLPLEYSHEPKIALQAGEDGLSCIDKIIHHAAKFLTDQGILILEVGCAKADFINKFANLNVTWVDFVRGGEGVLVINKAELKGNIDKKL